jgi:large subunit ribosomal protein L15
MQLHTLNRKHPNKREKLIGRGGKRGTYSGRGIKGQNARAGHKKRPELRDIIKKIPKLRGYQAPQVHDKPVVVNLSRIEKAFQNGEKVTPKTLVSKGVVSMTKGNLPKIKILGDGQFSKKLTFADVMLSKSAEEKLTKAGGAVAAR